MTRDAEMNLPIDPEDLIAYLDGEVDADTHRQIERCLAKDPQLLQRMREHQQVWDFLDDLPREEVRDDFAQTTLQMVAVAASDDAQKRARDLDARRNWRRAAAAASLIGASLAGFWVASSALQRPNRELLQDLPVIENLDALQQIESVDFLFALENEGLFVPEVSDEP